MEEFVPNIDLSIDCYSILEVSSSASLAELKQAKKRLAKAYSVDRLQNASKAVQEFAEEEHKKVNQAFEILSNPRFRSLYDAAIASRLRQQVEEREAQEKKAALVRIKKLYGEGDIKGAIEQARLLSARFADDVDLQNQHAALLYEFGVKLAEEKRYAEALTQLSAAKKTALHPDLRSQVQADIELLQSRIRASVPKSTPASTTPRRTTQPNPSTPPVARSTVPSPGKGSSTPTTTSVPAKKRGGLVGVITGIAMLGIVLVAVSGHLWLSPDVRIEIAPTSTRPMDTVWIVDVNNPVRRATVGSDFREPKALFSDSCDWLAIGSGGLSAGYIPEIYHRRGRSVVDQLNYSLVLSRESFFTRVWRSYLRDTGRSADTDSFHASFRCTEWKAATSSFTVKLYWTGSNADRTHPETWFCEYCVLDDSFRKLGSSANSAVTTGQVVLTSEPTGASVSEGGEMIGSTPLTLKDYPVGLHSFSVSLPSAPQLKPETLSARVNPFEPVEANVVFRHGTIQLTSEPTGATVWQGNKELGMTPLTLTNWPAGASIGGGHRFKLRFEFKDLDAGLIWRGGSSDALKSGETLNVNVKLQPSVLRIISGQANPYAGRRPPASVCGKVSQFGTTSWMNGLTGGRYQRVIPPGLTDAVAVAAGSDYDIALKADGKVICWGIDTFNVQNRSDRWTTEDAAGLVPQRLSDVVAIAAGSHYFMALKQNGSVVIWKAGSSVGQDLEGFRQRRDLVAINASGSCLLALTKGGDVIDWDYYRSKILTLPETVSGIVAIAAGSFHRLALKDDGTVVEWDSAGNSCSDIPRGLADVVSVAAGGTMNYAVKRDGTIVSWGTNEDHVGLTPSGLNGVVSVVCGVDTWTHILAAALKEDGTVVGWGSRDTADSLPRGWSDVVGISAFEIHGLAIIAKKSK